MGKQEKAAYAEYLKSDKWRTIRAQRLAMDNGECVLCGKDAKHVHHRRYPKKWGEETVNDLVCLCDVCHGKHHGKSQNTPTDTIEQKLGIVIKRVFPNIFNRFCIAWLKGPEDEEDDYMRAFCGESDLCNTVFSGLWMCESMISMMRREIQSEVKEDD